MTVQIVRYHEFKPCKTAFIDAHTPGSDKKDNFTIIGAGVSESPDQHVHIRETPGFNIGAAGQPPRCCNSLHTHRTAEVFFVLSQTWRFFWGRHGNAGQVTLEPGDLINIPTGMFRGFENVGEGYGMLMAVLGGDDAGGGVVWAPEVIEAAKQHGLTLGDNGILYDRNQGESLPANVGPMPLMSNEALAKMAEPTSEQVEKQFVARRQAIQTAAAINPASVLGAHALLVDRPGFEIDFVSSTSAPIEPYTIKRHEVLIVTSGQWQLKSPNNETSLGPGDTCLIAPGDSRGLKPTANDCGLLRVRNTDDPAGPTRWSLEQTKEAT